MNKSYKGTTRRVYTSQKNGLDVSIDITVNTNPALAKLLGYNQQAAYMYADICLTDEKGLCELYKPYNKDDILEALGWIDNGKTLSVVALHEFENEKSIDQYAERILAAV